MTSQPTPQDCSQNLFSNGQKLYVSKELRHTHDAKVFKARLHDRAIEMPSPRLNFISFTECEIDYYNNQLALFVACACLLALKLVRAVGPYHLRTHVHKRKVVTYFYDPLMCSYYFGVYKILINLTLDLNGDALFLKWLF